LLLNRQPQAGDGLLGGESDEEADSKSDEELRETIANIAVFLYPKLSTTTADRGIPLPETLRNTAIFHIAIHVFS